MSNVKLPDRPIGSLVFFCRNHCQVCLRLFYTLLAIAVLPGLAHSTLVLQAGFVGSKKASWDKQKKGPSAINNHTPVMGCDF